MAQTDAGQAKASRKLVQGTIGTLRKNEAVKGKVDKRLSPNVPMGSLKQNTAALRTKKIKTNVGI